VSDANALKFVEAGALLVALVLFVVWQLRDLKKAAAETARQRAQGAHAQNDSSDPTKAEP
jgi:hypothetical protein